jgi:hypothetical protein
MFEPFDKLTVEITRKDGILEARINQDGQRGSNLLSEHHITKLETAQNVCRNKLRKLGAELEFVVIDK